MMDQEEMNGTITPTVPPDDEKQETNHDSADVAEKSEDEASLMRQKSNLSSK